MGSESYDSYESHTRKRVGKACDRCRLKKSKCDGAHPCTRCRLDNTICYYGERKKLVDKVYPKGYVEILELQQAQLVAGLRKAFTLMLQCNSFPGGKLPEQEDGFPLTHDILDRLDVLHQPEHNPDGVDHTFEDDLNKIQKKLNEQQKPSGASPTTSTFSDSDTSQIDSPQLPNSPTDSWTSSKSPRKHPYTPPQLELPLPQKRQKQAVFDFEPALPIGQMPLFQDPVLMTSSPQPFASNSDIQFPGSFGDDNIGMVTFTETYEPMQTTWPTVAAYNIMNIFPLNTGADPEFESFMRSGFHT